MRCGSTGVSMDVRYRAPRWARDAIADALAAIRKQALQQAGRAIDASPSSRTMLASNTKR